MAQNHVVLGSRELHMTYMQYIFPKPSKEQCDSSAGFLSTHWSILSEVIKTPAMEREDYFLGYSTISCIGKKYGDTYLWPSMTVGRNTGR